MLQYKFNVKTFKNCMKKFLSKVTCTQFIDSVKFLTLLLCDNVLCVQLHFSRLNFYYTHIMDTQ